MFCLNALFLGFEKIRQSLFRRYASSSQHLVLFLLLDNLHDFQYASLVSNCAFKDISIRLPSLPPPRSLPSYPLRISSPLPLPQLSTLLNLLNQALDIIDISTWTGDPTNGPFISGQLRLLADTIDEAKAVMKGGEDVVGGKWWEDDFTGDDTVRQLFLYISFQPTASQGPSGPKSLTNSLGVHLSPPAKSLPPLDPHAHISPPYNSYPCPFPQSIHTPWLLNPHLLHHRFLRTVCNRPFSPHATNANPRSVTCSNA